MGRERGWKRGHLHLCCACLIVLLAGACFPLARQAERPVPCPQDRHYPHLQGLQPYVKAGNFEGAVRVRQELLDSSPSGEEADAALFDLALLAVHNENPKKDFRRSLQLFNRLTKEFPRSRLTEEARIWMGVLESIERAKRIDLEIEEKKKEIAK